MTCNYLVSLLQLYQGRQVDESALHAVETLHDDQDLLPRTMCLRLALADDLSQKLLQILHIVVLEHANVRAAQPDTETDGCVVQLVGDNEAAFRYQGRDDRRIGRKTHRADESIVLSDEASDKSLGLDVKFGGTTFPTSSTYRNAVATHTVLDGISASAACLCEPKVVVR